MIISYLDKLIHTVPFLPSKLQGSWVDRFWEKIEGNE